MKLPALIPLLLLGLSGATDAMARVTAERDVAAARRLFEENLDAIRRKDRAAYLAGYLRSPNLARTGFDGIQLGYEPHAARSTGSGFPDLFEAQDLRLVPVQPGVVYGTYRYRVRYGAEEHAGISERIFVRTSQGWRIAATTAFDAPPGTPPPPRALVGGTLVDGTGAPPIADAVVLMRGGRIECAGRRSGCPVPEGVGVTDVTGAWITPGLVDAHVHFSQTGWADGRPDALDLRDRFPYEKVQADLRARPERWLRSYLCSGVTAVFDVGGYPWTWGLRERAEPDHGAPHVAAAGPLLSTRDHWLNLPAERQFIYLSGEKAARDGVSYLASHGTTAVKVWFIPVADAEFGSMEAAVKAAGEAARAARLPLIVHATGLREAKAALRAGAALLVHSVWDQPVDDEFIRLARDRRTIYCPTLTVADGYVRLFASALSAEPPAVDDPHRCVDQETLQRLQSTPGLGAGRIDAAGLAARRQRVEEQGRIMAANLRRVHEAGITVAMGTDAGNPLTLHGPSVHAEMEAMAAAGMSPADVLVAATKGGAMAMGRLADLGTVEAGKIADLIVVGRDPTASVSNLRDLRYVIRGGLLRSVDELAAAPPAPAAP